MTFTITTSIPYVNAAPHLGHALELVQADVLARHRRIRGEATRLQSGTDDNSLKNALAAAAAGEPVRAFVDRHADIFAGLAPALDLDYDDFVRTSRDPRHAPAVRRLWQAAERNGDLYQRHYEGLYCVGCEAFYLPADLVDGRCSEHTRPPVPVSERNWFFRLHRYAESLRRLYQDGTIRILPEQRRNEVLAFIDGGLRDFSVSRDASRGRGSGLGVPVPGDPAQVMYVWWDALVNYLTGLHYGDPGSAAYRHWWLHGDRRVHVIGKGILRFHAIYWPAMLLSAGVPVPTDIYVHDYLTAEGAKLSKSAGSRPALDPVDPFELVREYGADAVRWWLLAEVPRVGDTDFTSEGLVRAVNRDLAGGLGNLVQRVTTMVHKYLDGVLPTLQSDQRPDQQSELQVDEQLRGLVGELPGRIDAALEQFAPGAATRAIMDAVRRTSQYIERTEPWRLARDRVAGNDQRLRVVLAVLVSACRTIADELSPFLPGLARKLSVRLAGNRLPKPTPAFARVELDARVR